MAKLTTWQATVQDDDTGAAVVEPVVTVRKGGPAGDLADLFDVAGSGIGNPVTGGTDGFVQFQAYPGRYWIQAADGGTFSQAWYWDAVPDEGLNWASRANLVTDWAAGIDLPDGAVLSDGTVQYVVSAGVTEIPDMPGLLPFGRKRPQHYGGSSPTLYVDPAGDDGHSGFSSGSPLATVSRAVDIISDVEIFSDETPRIILAAGTYTESVEVSDLSFNNRLVIQGPASTHPAAPTAILDGVNSLGSGLSVAGSRVDLRDVLVRNYTGDGVSADRESELIAQRVHSVSNSGYNLNISRLSHATVVGGRYAFSGASAAGLRVYSYSYLTISSGAAADGPIIEDNTIGIRVQSGYMTGGAATCRNNATGILGLYGATRVRCSGWEFSGNTTDLSFHSGAQVRVYGQGNSFLSGEPVVNFGYGSGDPAFGSEAGDASSRVFFSGSGFTHTGDTSATLVSTIFTIPADYFVDDSRALYVRVRGTASGVGGTKAVSIRVGGGNVVAPAVSANAGSVTWELDAVIVATGSSSQKYTVKSISGTSIVSNISGTRAIDMTSDRDVDVYVQLSDAGDSITVDSVRLELIG